MGYWKMQVQAAEAGIGKRFTSKEWTVISDLSTDIRPFLSAQGVPKLVADLAHRLPMSLEIRAKRDGSFTVRHVSHLVTFKNSHVLDGKEREQYHPVFRKVLSTARIAGDSIIISDRVPGKWGSVAIWKVSGCDNSRELIISMSCISNDGHIRGSSRQVYRLSASK
jgi:hypothetical protein